MEHIGAVLKKHIANCGYTIYKAASLANVNRTTLHKVLSGDRTITEDFLNKLLPILKLSSDEIKEIHELYEIEKTGEEFYLQRKYIEKMLKNLSYSSSMSSSLFTVPRHDNAKLQSQSSSNLSSIGGLEFKDSLSSLKDRYADKKPIQGEANISSLLSFLMLSEYDSNKSEILVNAPGNLPLLQSTLNHPLLNVPQGKTCCIRHITPMLKSPELSFTPLANLETLSMLLPYAVTKYFDYKVRLFYCQDLLTSSIQYAFPYWMVFHQAVLLLSADGEHIFPITEPSVVLYFKEQFFAVWKQSTPLIFPGSVPIETLKEQLGNPSISCRLRILEYQPCFSAFLNETNIERCVLPNIPERDTLVQYLILKSKWLTSSKKHSCIFSHKGLVDFVNTGYMKDFPPSSSISLGIADRIQMLRKLYWHCKYDTMFLRLANPVILPFPEHLNVIIEEKCRLIFTDSSASREYLQTTERTLLEAFDSFYEYLMESELIFTKDDTLKEIDSLIELLIQRLHTS